MNVFQLNYEARLQNWYDLRTRLEGSDIQTQCVEIDKWWQRAPLITHHLHLLDTDTWPDPWELLVENTYCEVARAVGICYTLSLLGVNDIEIVEATNGLGDDIILVLVDDAKYVMNYWPDTVLSNTLKDFNIKRRVDFKNLKLKI